jgi:hypothetical protein
MRLAVCTLSAVLLSGCSWLGNMGQAINGGGYGHHAQGASHYGYGHAQKGQHQYQAQHDPCQVFSVQAPIPQGCDPAQVTLGTAGGFPQQPNFGGGQFASQGYGSHAGVAHQQAAHYQPRKRNLRKPRVRGALSLGAEKSISGSLLNFSDAADLDFASSYNPQDFNQVIVEGVPADGQVTTTTFTANALARNANGVPVEPTQADIFAPGRFDNFNAPAVSFDDVYSTPLRLAAGAEYIVSPNTTVFANAGYTYAEGKNLTAARVAATPYQFVSVQNYDAAGNPDGAPEEMIIAGDTQDIASFNYDFTDQKRIDLEVGGRRYFNPLESLVGVNTLTPFVGASVGASHYNATSYNVTQSQALYSDTFASGSSFEISDRVDLYESQWVPSGQLNAGMEWQVTPKTALAFETGVRVEGARKYSNGERGDNNIAIPMTIRGSYNF